MVHNNRAELEVPEQSQRSLDTGYGESSPDMLEPAFDFDDEPMM